MAINDGEIKLKEPSKFAVMVDSLKHKVNRMNPWRKKEEGALIRFAERELRIAGLYDEDSDYGGMLAEAVMDLIHVFSDHNHSGFSANMTASIFAKLAKFKPITPLTGADDEWNDVGDGKYQNKRCAHVFKDEDRAYDISGKIFREPSGATYTSRDSWVDITFPYTPKSEIVDVEHE